MASRILVVEDDEATRDVMCTALDDAGYEVIAAANGADALDLMLLIGKRQPDLILLDLYMPRLDGWKFAQEYLLMPSPRAPIVVTTAASDAAEQAARINADGFLGKPFDIDELLKVVKEHARTKRT
jgi:CheY-like chemotaxis protein